LYSGFACPAVDVAPDSRHPPFAFAREQRSRVERLNAAGQLGSIEMQPDTWKPPITHGMPAPELARRSSARGYWIRLHRRSGPTRPSAARAESSGSRPCTSTLVFALVAGLDRSMSTRDRERGSRRHREQRVDAGEAFDRHVERHTDQST
jgi:hypothetical protein